MAGYEAAKPASLAAAPGPGWSSPCRAFLSNGWSSFGGVRQAFLPFPNRIQHLMRHDVLSAAGREHQLEQDPLLQLFDGVDHGAALVAAN